MNTSPIFQRIHLKAGRDPDINNLKQHIWRAVSYESACSFTLGTLLSQWDTGFSLFSSRDNYFFKDLNAVINLFLLINATPAITQIIIYLTMVYGYKSKETIPMTIIIPEIRSNILGS